MGLPGEWYVTIAFRRPFSGEEVTRDPCLTVRIPFADRASAQRALAEARISVEGSPGVIAGEVIAEVPAITAGEVIR